MKLFAKIYSAVFVSFVAAIALISYVTTVKQISDAEHRTIDLHRTIGSLISKDIERGHIESKWPFESLKRLSNHHNFLFWWIIDDTGSIYLADTSSLMGSVARDYLPELSAISSDENIFLNRERNYGVFIRKFGIGKSKWVFCLGFSTQDIAQARRAITLSVTLFSASGLAALGLILYFIIKHFTKPVESLEEGARQVGVGRFDHRVRVHSQDELGYLAQSFNKMAEHLQTSTTSIENLNREIAERKRAEQALQKSENKYRTLLENLPQKIFLKDQKSVYVSCNENYAKDLKIKAEAITGKTDYEFYPKELAEKYRADDKRIMESGKTENIEEKYIQKGREIVVHTVKTPVRNEQGNVIGILGIFWDITEQKRAEEKQAELLEQLESANKELKDFAYVVSHDLKAPLRGIKTLTSWISTDHADKLDEDGKQQINLLAGRVDRMNNLIEGILEYSKVGRIREETVRVNLNELVPQLVDLLAPPENITVIIESELPVINFEKTRIAQVFQNLLSNAIKFMDKPQGQIRIGCTEDDGFWKFSVADNGPGIDEKYFDKIFQIFQTLAPRDELESTGIGLTLVKKIIELNNGTIWVKSAPSQGTTFFFTLPKQQMGAEHAELQANLAT